MRVSIFTPPFTYNCVVVSVLQSKSVAVVMVACFVSISVITLVEPTIKFSAVKSPTTDKSPVISVGKDITFATYVKANVLFKIFVILSSPIKSV